MAAAPSPLSETAHAADGVAAAYHRRTKHRLQAWAAGPETLDWDAQPDPFRRWHGAPQVPLPRPADDWRHLRWSQLADARVPAPPGLAALGLLFELSFALSAWKQQGPDRWALRCTPSSGNLHPTEAYVLARSVPGLDDGLYHYAPREHALQQRLGAVPTGGAPGLWVGLSSIHWREAWKYGERAFRYCQLDLGHALGALRYAAAVLGWRACCVPGLAPAALAALLGLDRDADFTGGAEREEPEALVALHDAGAPPAWTAGDWRGRASRLDAHPMYRWPVIDQVAAATRRPRAAADVPALRAAPPVPPAPPAPCARPAVDLIRGRRSAQRFDRRAVMPGASLASLLQALCGGGLPWDVAPAEPRVHAVLFAHRVEGLVPGAYLLPRSARGQALLRAALDPALDWQAVPGLGAPLVRLAENPALAGTLRTLNCHQALGADAMLAVALLAEWDGDDASYRARLQEAGLAGQVLYLEAEAAGLRGTGIGCYFDDALHELLGLRGEALQSLYHFTVGQALDDPRLQSEPPYAHLETLDG